MAITLDRPKLKYEPTGPYPDVVTRCHSCGANEARHQWPGVGHKLTPGWEFVMCHSCGQTTELSDINEILVHVWPAVPRYVGAGLAFVELCAPVCEYMCNTDKDIATVPQFVKRSQRFAGQGDTALESWLHANLEQFQDSLEPRAFLGGWIDADGFLEIDEVVTAQGDFMITWRDTFRDWCKSIDAEINAGGS